jgi:hypothetical protein
LITIAPSWPEPRRWIRWPPVGSNPVAKIETWLALAIVPNAK